MKKLFLILLLYSNSSLSGQGNWEVIEIPDEFIVYDIRTFYHDTVDNALWMGGDIRHADSVPSSCYTFLLKYDGINWKHFGPFGSAPIFDICRFDDKIVFAGSFNNYLGDYCGGVDDEYEGIAYIKNDTLGNFGGLQDGIIYDLEVVNNELYTFGRFDTIFGIPAFDVAKYNGSEWSQVCNFPDVVAGGYTICGSLYNEELYVGGDYYNFDHFNSYKGDITKYNGTDWELVGGGTSGSYTAISELKIFEDELYAAGIIYKNAGNAGNGIQKWNGAEWSSVGGDLKGYGNNLGSLLFVNDLEVHNDELYIAGVFEYAGDIEASDIVKWDGEKYCSFGGEFYGGLNGIAFMNDTMYVAGAFTTIDGIQTQQGMLAKYIGGNTVVECSTVGIKENDALLQLDIYPSPAINEINIYLPKGDYKNLEVEVYNLLGQKVQYKNTNATENKKINIQIQNFSKGQYTVLLKEKGVAMGSGRFIKE
jgi:Secretion system C-terminal sorting domain